MLFPYPKTIASARERCNINSGCIKINITRNQDTAVPCPTIYHGRETALPCPLYHSGAAGIYLTNCQLSTVNCQLSTDTYPDKFQPPYPPDFAANNRQKVPQLP